MDETPLRVLQAAGPIFADKGYEGATVREICAAANANLASINYHFGDKQQLYLETVKLAHTLRLLQVPTPEWPADTPGREKLALFIHAVLSRMLGTAEQAWQTRLLMREMIRPTMACRNIVEDFIRPQLSVLLGILDEMLPGETEEHERYQVAFSIIGQCLHYRVAREFVSLLIPERQRQAHFRLDQLADHITRFSLAALDGLGQRSVGERDSEVMPPLGNDVS